MLRIAALVAAGTLVAQPVAGQTGCITAPEAEAMTMVAMPEILRQTGTVCTARLPATSLIRRSDSNLIDRYQREADRAWPNARSGIVKLSDPAIAPLLDSDFARGLLVSLLVPQIVGRIAVSDCAMIDRLVTLLDPLPPRNTAGIVVAALQYLKAEKAKGARIDVPDLPLCQATSR